MGPRQRKHKTKHSKSLEKKERDQDTIRAINQLLETEPIDFVALRRIAAVRGLVSNEVRARVWPILLGVQPKGLDQTLYQVAACNPHRDSSVVDVDVQRSLWSYTEGWTDAEREEKRTELRTCLNAVIGKSQGELFYYQGLHDVASVLLFVAGEGAAMQMLDRLVNCHFRDCTRNTLDAVLELLTLVMPILEQVDPELHRHISATEVQPFFALSWLITWFSHNVPELDNAARIFDVFLSSHPLMPLYFAAATMKSARAHILACECDLAEMHRLLNNLPILRWATADQLAQEAVQAYKEAPPQTLLKQYRLRMLRSTTASARLESDHYEVPAEPPLQQGLVPRERLSALAGVLMPSDPAGRRRRLSYISGSIITLGFAVVVVLTGLNQRLADGGRV
ncbi:hypothetical protein WJX73_001235 [Symbiochloris irregularis]|uniref:Rab-GAP TBC domain-containing protein n=1 Tax=Symbiochloris irregularis TaxID=706552 RepID=A0AAW1PQD9_9CHLO